MSIIFFSYRWENWVSMSMTYSKKHTSGTSENLNLQEMSEFLEESGSNRIKHKFLELTMEKNEQQSEEQWVEVQEIFWMEETELTVLLPQMPSMFSVNKEGLSFKCKRVRIRLRTWRVEKRIETVATQCDVTSQRTRKMWLRTDCIHFHRIQLVCFCDLLSNWQLLAGNA